MSKCFSGTSSPGCPGERAVKRVVVFLAHKIEPLPGMNQERVPLYFCPLFCKMVNSFQFFSCKACRKIVIKSLLEISVNPNYVATLPCDVFGAYLSSFLA